MKKRKNLSFSAQFKLLIDKASEPPRKRICEKSEERYPKRPMITDRSVSNLQTKDGNIHFRCQQIESESKLLIQDLQHQISHLKEQLSSVDVEYIICNLDHSLDKVESLPSNLRDVQGIVKTVQKWKKRFEIVLENDLMKALIILETLCDWCTVNYREIYPLESSNQLVLKEIEKLATNTWPELIKNYSLKKKKKEHIRLLFDEWSACLKVVDLKLENLFKEAQEIL